MTANNHVCLRSCGRVEHVDWQNSIITCNVDDETRNEGDPCPYRVRDSQKVTEPDRIATYHGGRTEPDKPDMVNHPPHYTAGGIECIDALEAATTGLSGWEAGLTWNVIKYMWRWKRKNGLEDLQKARFYLSRLIEKLQKGETD